MKQFEISKVVLVIALSCAFHATGCEKKAGPGEPPAEGSAALGAGRGMHQPPAEALAACEGKKSGDACTAKMGDREQSGTCEAPPQAGTDTRLSCRPERPAKRPE